MYTVQFTVNCSHADCRRYAYDNWNISVLKHDLKVAKDGDVRVPCDRLFQDDMADHVTWPRPNGCGQVTSPVLKINFAPIIALDLVKLDTSNFVCWLIHILVH